MVRQYQRTDSVNYLVEASYFANSSVQSVTYPSVPGASDRRTVNYTNDSAGRPASVSSSATSYAPAASVSSIGYAAHNNVARQTYGNGLIHGVSYNNRLQTTEIKLGTSGAPTSVIDLVYSYGTTTNNGDLQNMSYSGGGLSYTQTFSYDALNRLTTAQENSGSNWSQTNGYDRYGNRWINLGGGNQSLYFTDSNNRITGWSYDNAGNLLNDTNHSYTYDAENKISKVDGTSAYVYDGAGQRIRKLIGENLRFVYGIGGQLLAEFNGSTGALTKEYIYGVTGLLATIEPAALNSNGTRYTTADHLGSPRVITNSSSGVVSRHDYMPFGEELGSGVGGRTSGMGFAAADGQRQKFTQKERDSETGLDYFGARYYGSLLGRFTSADPLIASGRASLPQSWNRYAYVLNHPLRLIDPDGLMETDPDYEEQKKRAQLQQQGQPAQTPPSSPSQPAGAPQTPTGVTVTVAMEANTMVNVPVGGSLFTGVGAILALTPTDQNGNPIPNVTVIESVSPSDTIQNPNPMTFPTGTVTDLVGSGERHPASQPKSMAQAGAIIVPRLDTPRSIIQTHQMSIFSPTSGIMAIATHTRTLTNVDRDGNLVNNVQGNRKVNNYRITDISPVTVIQKPMVMCPIRF